MMFARSAFVVLLVSYVQYSSAKKYEEHGQEVIDKVKAAKLDRKDEDFVKTNKLGLLADWKTNEPKKERNATRKATRKQLGRKDLPTRAKRAAVTIPSSFDWRDKAYCNSVHEIRDQNCGDCWAVASAAVMSDRYCIATGNSRFFSAKQVATCSNLTDPNTGCKGGRVTSAMIFYRDNGVATGGDPTLIGEPAGCLLYPETWSIPTKCPSKCDDASTPELKMADEYYRITSKNVTEIQEEIFLNGPVVASMEVFEDFEYYESGVYQHVYGISEGGHAIRMVGWGTDGDGIPFWICLNQWGRDWGLGGAFRILRGKDHCGIESSIVSVIPSEAYI